MSCETLNSQAVNLNISLGNLPEGYCPSSFQQFGNDLAARLIISNSGSASSFAIGSNEPTSNVGPWLKDCLEWFVFDDITSRYRPISATSNLDQLQVFDADGTFIVPDDVYRIEVEAWGGGGGAGDKVGAIGGGGGGGGGYGHQFFNVLPAQVIAVTVGSGGTGGAPATAGTASTFLTLSAGGGDPGLAGAGSGGEGGLGGTVSGSDFSVQGQTGEKSDSILGQGHGGTGGSSPNGGGGGVASAVAAKLIGVAPGGGGAGGTNAEVNAGGAGAKGRVIVRY